MTISYSWLCTYLPVKPGPDDLSKILTSLGLEVEKMESFEEVKGGLQGLVIGEVLETSPHPNADKLKLTRVNIGEGEPLSIVCGAPNVAAGQKVVVATIGTTIYPSSGEPLTMKLAKIRGEQSMGMICAEDEIGLGSSHAGIMILPNDLKPGTKAADYFKPFSDTIYEIGLTPNRMDAMSHWGVARDVCAYLTWHEGKKIEPLLPPNRISTPEGKNNIEVRIENNAACRRYAGLSISGLKVGESPKWLKERLLSVGVRPINNVVDVTNFILHETGQPLHAFDLAAIKDNTILVKNLPSQTVFVTLDEKERKLHEEDLMICNSSEPMCIAGVFGGLHSGVTNNTSEIFLESAWFDPVSIRRTSFRHGLRTEAATRFEKGIDISSTVTVLLRAAELITEVCGGTVSSQLIDVYPQPEQKREIILSRAFVKKLSGKEYSSQGIRTILEALGFELEEKEDDSLKVIVPFHKRDVSQQADLVEEIIRVDGLDNIEIGARVTITPAVDENYEEEERKERISNLLCGLGFSEIQTNSLTNSAYFSEEEKESIVTLLNNLSTELNIMRPSMIHTALEVIGFNHNRKNADLALFEFGRTYHRKEEKYFEEDHLCLYLTGETRTQSWKGKAEGSDLFFLKGTVEALFKALGIAISIGEGDEKHILSIKQGKRLLGTIQQVLQTLTSKFDIRTPVLYADLLWNKILQASSSKINYKEVSKFPSVERDLAMVIPQNMPFGQIQKSIADLRLPKLRDLRLFDIFESEKLGKDKKSMAINFIFMDEEKTLTDKEIDGWMNKIMTTLQKDLGAEIRK